MCVFRPSARYSAGGWAGTAPILALEASFLGRTPEGISTGVEMNEEPNGQPDLWTLAGRISTLAESDSFFARLLREEKNYADPGVQSLVHIAIRTLMENSRTNTERAREIIEKHILPPCLQQHSIL